MICSLIQLVTFIIEQRHFRNRLSSFEKYRNLLIWFEIELGKRFTVVRIAQLRR